MQKALLEGLDRWLKRYAGLPLWGVLAAICALAALGAVIGVAFPKYEATAFLQFPEATTDKDWAVDLPSFKRVAASYSSATQLEAFAAAKGLQQSAAAARLIMQSRDPRSWERAATPVFPFSKRDQRELGDIKDAAKAFLLGLELKCDAPAPALAAEMVDILGDFYANAVMRERIRSWIVSGQSEAIATAKQVEAAIVRAELDVALFERRVQDMKQILAKYPGVERMDTRQVISLNARDESQRFLSPLAQVVGFESAISERREQILRWSRELKQKQLLAGFFVDALPIVDESATVQELLPRLQELASKRFSAADSSQEWVREASLKVFGALDGFSVQLKQFALRENSVRVDAAQMRKPLPLAGMFSALGVLAIVAFGLVRASVPAEKA